MRCEIRINEDDYKLFLEKAESFKSVSAMVRYAVSNLDTGTTTNKRTALNELTLLYQRFQNNLSKVGGNLNQASKRANELAIDNQLSTSFFEKIFVPHVQEVRKLIMEVKREQTKIIKSLIVP